MHEKDPVLEFLEQDKEQDYTAFLQTKAKAKALAEAAKTAPTMSAPAPTASTPEGGQEMSIRSVLGLDRVTPTKTARVAGMMLNQQTGAPESKVMDALTAALPYISPGTGAAKSLGMKALTALLPVGAASKELLSERPTSAGGQAENVVGGVANLLRESGLLKLPGVPGAMQTGLAAAAEGGVGNALSQLIDKGFSGFSPKELAKTTGFAGALGTGAGFLPTRMGSANSTQNIEDALSGPLKDINTYGVQKPFTGFKNAMAGYLKAPPSHLTKAGVDRNFVKELRDKPNEALDNLFDRTLGRTTSNTGEVTAANQTLGKLADLVASQPEAKKELKEKTGEYLITKYFNPGGNGKPFQDSLRELEKGGVSALDKILTSTEKTAFLSALDDINTITRTEKLGNIRAGVSSGGGIWVSLLDKIFLLTPGHMATHILERAGKPGTDDFIKDTAEYVRNMRKNPLSGGRLTRAAIESLEKGLKEAGAQETMLPQEPKSKWNWSSLIPGR